MSLETIGQRWEGLGFEKRNCRKKLFHVSALGLGKKVKEGDSSGK